MLRLKTINTSIAVSMRISIHMLYFVCGRTFHSLGSNDCVNIDINIDTSMSMNISIGNSGSLNIGMSITISVVISMHTGIPSY